MARSESTDVVAQAPSRTRIALDRTPSAGERTAVTVRVASVPASVGANGRVVVRVDGKVVRRVRLDDGRVVLRMVFAPGKHVLAVSYAGSSSVAASDAKVKVRARR